MPTSEAMSRKLNPLKPPIRILASAASMIAVATSLITISFYQLIDRRFAAESQWFNLICQGLGSISKRRSILSTISPSFGAAIIREMQGFSTKIFCFVIDRRGWFEATSYLAAPAMTISTVLSLPHDPNGSPEDSYEVESLQGVPCEGAILRLPVDGRAIID